jgi:hypothetical protein
MKKLTPLQWAAICTIHQVPDYQFKYNELSLAKRMATNHLLIPTKKGYYKTTQLSEKLYKEMTSSIFIF